MYAHSYPEKQGNRIYLFEYSIIFSIPDLQPSISTCGRNKKSCFLKTLTQQNAMRSKIPPHTSNRRTFI